MKPLITTLTLLAAALALATPAAAQPPMLYTPDAKALGMGGVTMTTISASHAIYNNPAMGLFSPIPSQVSASYLRQGTYDYYAVTGGYRFKFNNLVQAGWRQYFRESGNSDMAVDLGYSRRIGEHWAVGGVGRYINTKRYDISPSMSSFYLDLGAAYSMTLENVGEYANLRAGAKFSNLGSYSADPTYNLPMDLTAGAALETFFSDAHALTVAADVGYYFVPYGVNGAKFSVGAEYNLMQLIQMRAGYNYGQRSEYYPSYGSVGVGLRILHLRLDFAYLIAKNNTLMHNTYSLSFGLDF